MYFVSFWTVGHYLGIVVPKRMVQILARQLAPLRVQIRVPKGWLISAPAGVHYGPHLEGSGHPLPGSDSVRYHKCEVLIITYCIIYTPQIAME